MRVLLLGAGGLGCASALALARSGADLALTFVDPDRVEIGNLHRQVLFGPHDVGAPKAERAAAAVAALSAGRIAARGIAARFEPVGALALLREHDVVIEGTDRYEAKFLAADAARLADVPIVHAGVVGWSGWAMACLPGRTACLRCVFEDVPHGAPVATCAEHGVIGPVVGVLGTLQAALALRLLAGLEADGAILRYDARSGTARRSAVRRRSGCTLCGEAPTIRDLRGERYAPRAMCSDALATIEGEAR